MNLIINKIQKNKMNTTYEYNSNINYKLGKNKHENWEIIKLSESNDLWFHLNSFPSGHLVLNYNNISKKNIKISSQIVKDNSKYKTIPNVKVVYCPISNIKFGSKIGEVIIKSSKKCKYIII